MESDKLMGCRKVGQTGFTLVEVLICVIIIAILFALSSISLGQPQSNVTVASATNQLLSDLRAEQLLAMAGDQGTTTSQQPHGIYVQSTSYTLFSTSTYSAGDSNNFVVTPSNGITFTTTLPSTQVVFSKGSGDVSGFVNGSNTISVVGATGGVNKTITIGRFGALSSN